MRVWHVVYSFTLQKTHCARAHTVYMNCVSSQLCIRSQRLVVAKNHPRPQRDPRSIRRKGALHTNRTPISQGPQYYQIIPSGLWQQWHYLKPSSISFSTTAEPTLRRCPENARANACRCARLASAKILLARKRVAQANSSETYTWAAQTATVDCSWIIAANAFDFELPSLAAKPKGRVSTVLVKEAVMKATSTAAYLGPVTGQICVVRCIVTSSCNNVEQTMRRRCNSRLAGYA